MRQTIHDKTYDTETATLLATDRFSPGERYARTGTLTSLYRTPSGNFFTLHDSCGQHDLFTISPLTQQLAYYIFDQLEESVTTFETAFGAPWTLP